MIKLRPRVGPQHVYLAVCVLVGFGIATRGWTETWSLFRFRPMLPPFADLRTIQAGMAAASHGLNPQITNPGDPWGRAMNYPSAWLAIARFLHWEREGNYLAFAGASAAAFVACCFDLIRRSRSYWAVALALSGASALMVERGNNDMVIFALVYLAAVSARPLFVALIPLATLLKVYPLLTVAAFVARPRLALLLGALCLAALAVLAPELATIRAATPNDLMMSFGARTLSDVGAVMGHALPPLAIAALLITVGMALFVLAPATFRAIRPGPTETRLFLCGGAIFLGAFVLGSNWDYRLTFLLMTMPLILTLDARLYRLVVLTLMIAAFNQPMLSAAYGDGGVLINLAAKAALFVALVPLAFAVLQGELDRLLARKDRVAAAESAG